MTLATRTPEGEPNRCPVCGKVLKLEPSEPARDAPCPHCGSLVWFIETANTHAPAIRCIGFPVYSITDGARRTKEQAIRTVLDRLVQDRSIGAEHYDVILGDILRREQLGSTGIGRGVAIPHCKTAPLDRIVGAVATFSDGVDFGSLDGEPVKVMCLMVSPGDRPGDHLRMLERISRRLRDGF
jgi:PTS system fructose-specific IIA component/PTS system nitrogen regulatory IIA component